MSLGRLRLLYYLLEKELFMTTYPSEPESKQSPNFLRSLVPGLEPVLSWNQVLSQATNKCLYYKVGSLSSILDIGV